MPDIRSQIEEVRSCLEEKLEDKRILAKLMDDLVEAIEEENIELEKNPRARCEQLHTVIVKTIEELSEEDVENLTKAEEEEKPPKGASWSYGTKPKAEEEEE